jgi:hypothetical protein
MSIDVFVDVLQSKLCHELNAFPTVRRIIARELVKSQIERAHVLDLSTINSNRARHATIADHLIELGSRDIAASSWERPRRGTGLSCDRARVIAPLAIQHVEHDFGPSLLCRPDSAG